MWNNLLLAIKQKLWIYKKMKYKYKKLIKGSYKKN